MNPPDTFSGSGTSNYLIRDKGSSDPATATACWPAIEELGGSILRLYSGCKYNNFYIIDKNGGGLDKKSPGHVSRRAPEL